MGENFKTFCVVNPHSANGRTGKNWPKLADAVRETIGAFDYALTSRPMEAPDITRKALAKGYEMIVAVGGDGNNNEVVNGFFDGEKQINPEAVFAIIPGGTGGDLARLLGVRNLPARRIAQTLTGRNAVVTDVGKLYFTNHDGNREMRYFINIADLGIGGETVAIVNRTTKALGGRMSFLIGSLRGTLAYRNRHVVYSIDDGPEKEGRFYMIAAALGQYFGGGMWAAPSSVHNDGLFDILIIGDISLVETVKLGTKIYKGAHLTMAKVELVRGKKITARSDEKVYLDMDGEQPGILPATFEIRPQSIRMKQLKPEN